MELPLPVIDLNDADSLNVAKLGDACLEHGFFAVRGHSVPEDLLASVFGHFRQFFGQTDAAKQSIAHNKHAKGYQSWGEQTLDYAAQKCGDTKESWAVMDETLSVPEDGLPFHSPNQWPDATLLPQFRPQMEQLVGHMKQLRDRVNRLVAAALGQPPDFFEPFFAQPLDMLRAFHYHSPEGSDPDAGVFGAGAHTDWGHITYLMSDGTQGLEYYHKDSWHKVPHLPGAFVCNIADLLSLWSGGQFKSVQHRVVVAPGVHRYSCAYFTVPAWDAWVKPLQLPGLDASSAAGGTAATAAGGAAAGTAVAAGSSAAGDAAGCGHAAGTNGDTGTAADAAVADGTVAAGAGPAVEGDGVVLVEGQVMNLGPKGVRVQDYITAKYQAHFAVAGKAK